MTTADDTRTAPPAIEARGLSRRFGARTVLDGLDLIVGTGEVYGLLGPNGAGKSTTVDLLVGLQRPDTGTVRVFGADPAADDPASRARIGVQLQSGRLPDKLRVAEALDLFGSFYPDPVPSEELMDRFGLRDHGRTPFARLSGGLQQRLSIALALVGRPRLAILDELTTGLDPEARRSTWSLIEELRDDGLTILLVTHFMDEAERLCDRVGILAGGRLVAEAAPRTLAEQTAPADRAAADRPSLEDAYLACTRDHHPDRRATANA